MAKRFLFMAFCLRSGTPRFTKAGINNKDLMKMINELSEATIEDGGTGAFYIYLKKNKN